MDAEYVVFYWDYDEAGVHGGEEAGRNQHSADRPRWSDRACAARAAAAPGALSAEFGVITRVKTGR